MQYISLFILAVYNFDTSSLDLDALQAIYEIVSIFSNVFHTLLKTYNHSFLTIAEFVFIFMGNFVFNLGEF